MEDLVRSKDQGNELFKQKKYSQAILKFNQVVAIIEARESKDYLSADTEAGKLYVVCLLNSAFASINLKTIAKYNEAILYCDKALAVDQKNLKGLYRRGLARKEKAHLIETEEGNKEESLLEVYQKSKDDFEKLCLLDKTNELATKHLSETIKDIYRVTVARGEKVDLGSGKQATSKSEKNPYAIPEGQKKVSGPNMERILKDYKVEEATSQIQEKIRGEHLTGPLPELRSDLQKALRTIEKSDECFINFVNRFDEAYLRKVQPTFDILEKLVNVIIRRGTPQASKNALLGIKAQKSFVLLWKSLSKKQKEVLRQKWVEFGLPEGDLA